jgi:hypothetical protein
LFTVLIDIGWHRAIATLHDIVGLLEEVLSSVFVGIFLQLLQLVICPDRIVEMASEELDVPQELGTDDEHLKIILSS